MGKYDHIRQSAYEANMQLPKLGLVVFTFGNVSAVDRTLGVFAIKPSGVPYETLSPEKMVIVDFDGKTVDGTLRPSSDTKTHAILYKYWEKSAASHILIRHTLQRGHKLSAISPSLGRHMLIISRLIYHAQNL